MPADPRRVKDLFVAALDIADPRDRQAFLDRECDADGELRRRLAVLLAAHERPDAAVDRPLAGATIDDPGPADVSGAVIAGRYKLLEEVGEGGMGTVWMAEQRDPVKRLVALKLIKPGMDTRAVLARFEAERQALALMDHPSIAKVFDGGTTEQGRPYFAMELVKGLPLTEYCDDRRMSVRDRLDLFMHVCSAVQHAHQKGVIHRDLKPSNILVTEHDGKPVPKVIDFGLAKALHGPQVLTERTLHTSFGAVVGTPLYMAPEQVGINALDVDTRADIYALGVILYELLTGTTPLEKKRLHEAAWEEMRRLIREEEPPRPSTRLSSSRALPSLAATRRIEPAKLSRLVRGDLDWIVLKALEKDRNRRYDTANGLAMDVRRYLTDEPVLACPPSAAYRLRKFVRRNRAGLTAVAVVAGVLVAGLAVSIWQAIRATQAERLAAERLADEVEARREVDEAGRAARANETRAVTEARRATVVADLLQQMLASANPDLASRTGLTVRELLDDFAAGLDQQLKDQPDVEAQVRGTIGRTYWRLGLFDQAEHHLARALALRRASADPKLLAQSLVDWGWVLNEQHKFVPAESAVREALALYRASAAEPRKVLAALHALQMTAWGQKNWDEVGRIVEDARRVAATTPGKEYPELACLLHVLAGVKCDQGEIAEADRLARESVEMLRRAGAKDSPELAFALRARGRVQAKQGSFGDAEASLRESLTIFRKNYPDDQYHGPKHAVYDLADVLRAQGKPAEAEAVTRDSARRLLERTGFTPHSFSDWLALAEARRMGQLWEMASHAYQEAAKLSEPADLEDRLTVGRGLRDVGRGLLDQQKFADSAAAMRRGAELLEQGVSEAPKADTARLSEDLAGTLAYLSVGLERLQRLDEAVETRRKAIAIWHHLGEQDPEVEWYVHEEAYFSTTLAELLLAAGKPQEAVESARGGVHLHQRLCAKYPDNRDYPPRLFRSRQVLLGTLYSQGATDEAVVILHELIDQSKGAAADDSPETASLLALLGGTLLKQRKPADAEPVLRRCLAIREKVEPDGWPVFNARSMLGGALFGQKKYAEAEPLLLAGLRGLADRADAIPAAAKDRLTEAADRLIELYDALGKSAEAAKWRSEREKYATARPERGEGAASK